MPSRKKRNGASCSSFSLPLPCERADPGHEARNGSRRSMEMAHASPSFAQKTPLRMPNETEKRPERTATARNGVFSFPAALPSSSTSTYTPAALASSSATTTFTTRLTPPARSRKEQQRRYAPPFGSEEPAQASSVTGYALPARMRE